MSHFDKRLDGDSKDVFHTIEVGHLVLNRNCDETEVRNLAVKFIE